MPSSVVPVVLSDGGDGAQALFGASGCLGAEQHIAHTSLVAERYGVAPRPNTALLQTRRCTSVSRACFRACAEESRAAQMSKVFVATDDPAVLQQMQEGYAIGPLATIRLGFRTHRPLRH